MYPPTTTCKHTVLFYSVDPNDQKKTACYDIDVEVDDTLKTQMNSFLLSTASQQEIAGLDNKVQTKAEQPPAVFLFYFFVLLSLRQLHPSRVIVFPVSCSVSELVCGGLIYSIPTVEQPALQQMSHKEKECMFLVQLV